MGPDHVPLLANHTDWHFSAIFLSFLPSSIGFTTIFFLSLFIYRGYWRDLIGWLGGRLIYMVGFAVDGHILSELMVGDSGDATLFDDTTGHDGLTEDNVIITWCNCKVTKKWWIKSHSLEIFSSWFVFLIIHSRSHLPLDNNQTTHQCDQLKILLHGATVALISCMVHLMCSYLVSVSCMVSPAWFPCVHIHWVAPAWFLLHGASSVFVSGALLFRGESDVLFCFVVSTFWYLLHGISCMVHPLISVEVNVCLETWS